MARISCVGTPPTALPYSSSPANSTPTSKTSSRRAFYQHCQAERCCQHGHADARFRFPVSTYGILGKKLTSPLFQFPTETGSSVNTQWPKSEDPFLHPSTSFLLRRVLTISPLISSGTHTWIAPLVVVHRKSLIVFSYRCFSRVTALLHTSAEHKMSL